MECPNCHHWNEAGARFCEECGFELATVANDAPAAKVSITGNVDAPVEASVVPNPAPQDLVPVDSPAIAPVYAGPRLILEKTGTIFKLGDLTVIGREEPTVQIDFDGYEDGKYISHRHAQISKHPDAFYVEDLGSTNATRVNGVRLQQGQAQPLKEGDKIRFGKIEVTFHEQ